jgi:hypothetical protein
MKTFKEWQETSVANINMNRLGGSMGLFGTKTHSAEAPIVTRMTSMIRSLLHSGRTPAAIFDELLEALPVAFSNAVPGLPHVPRSYGMSQLSKMRHALAEKDAEALEKEVPNPMDRDPDNF